MGVTPIYITAAVRWTRGYWGGGRVVGRVDFKGKALVVRLLVVTGFLFIVTTVLQILSLLSLFNLFFFLKINPFTSPACTISGLNNARTRLKTVYFPVLYHLFSVSCILMEILLHASAKKQKTQRLNGFKFRTFMGLFQMTHGSEGVNH